MFFCHHIVGNEVDDRDVQVLRVHDTVVPIALYVHVHLVTIVFSRVSAATPPRQAVVEQRLISQQHAPVCPLSIKCLAIPGANLLGINYIRTAAALIFVVRCHL